MSFFKDDEGEAENGKPRSWDDEFVLKRQFSALIPAFDPRPGRTNVNQISDLDIPAPGKITNLIFILKYFDICFNAISYSFK